MQPSCKNCSWSTFMFPSAKFMWHLTLKMDNKKRELATKDESTAKTWWVIMLEVKSESSINEAVEEIADHRVLHCYHCRYSRHAARGSPWGKHFDINGENSCDERRDSSSGKVTSTKSFTLKALSEVLKLQRRKFGSWFWFKPRKEYDSLPSAKGCSLHCVSYTVGGWQNIVQVLITF